MKYDLPQPECALEWWYYNAHVKIKSTGEPLSCFASFFRQVEAKELVKQGQERGFMDAVLWAISDPARERYYMDSLLDKDTPSLLKEKIKSSGKPMTHIEMAMMEVVNRGCVPNPDRLMSKRVVAKDKLSIELDECTLKKGTNNKDYEVTLFCPRTGTRAHLVFAPRKAAYLHGMNGVVNDMYYYFIPRCAVTGYVILGDRPTEKLEVEGEGWYDREFGGERDLDTSRDALDAWTWFSIQLSNGGDITVFIVEGKDSKEVIENVAVYCPPGNGKRIAMDNFTVTTSNLWPSMVTYTEYPMTFQLTCSAVDLNLTINCAFKHQEFLTLLVAGGGFYEGRVTCTGVQGGMNVTGVGFLEKKNHKMYTETQGLLKQVGIIVQKSLQRLYPLDASRAFIDHNVLGRHAMREVDTKKVCDVIFKPVRTLIDRAGKSWRSLILVSVINAISQSYVDTSNYIAIAELLHVGSLIVDDIEDNSTVRRGGPCVHLEYGIAHAINASTACYFLAPRLAGVDDLPKHKQLPMYHLFFDSLRAGHAGQGLDILGLDSYMAEAVRTGDVKPLENALKAIHIYKTGGPAGSLCRMACIITDATEEQSVAMDGFGTAAGLAFQIVDDALNLVGFEGDLKELGEDIRDGKITYPVIKAIPRLNSEQRNYMWAVLQEKTSDKAKIKSVIDLLNSVRAIDDCLEEAKDIVEKAWRKVDPLLPDSLAKLMMRAFTFYLTERKK
jgi:geranylgeranyl pyrophosphate synthase/predicted secreted hydrolase